MSSLKTSRALHSPKYVQRKRKRLFVTVFLFILCIVTISVSIILLLRSPFFKIDRIIVNGSPTLPLEKIQQEALSLLDKDSEDIKKTLLEDFKEIETVSIRRSGLRTLTLNLEERLPAAVVCLGFRDEDLPSSDCYTSDKHGYIFMSATTTDSSTRYYLPTDKGDNPLGTTFIIEKRFQELERFVVGSRKGGLSPLGVLIGEDGDYEMYMKNKKGNSEVTVYFDDKAPFDNTLSNLLTFWQNSLASTTIAFDYINLRFGNTVYYSTQ